MDKEISKKEIDQIITKHDLAKDGRISYQEFKVMMLGEDDIVDTISETTN